MLVEYVVQMLFFSEITFFGVGVLVGVELYEVMYLV